MAHKILIADDDPHILDVVIFALEQAGFKTMMAKNGEMALSSIPAFQPDLLVLDINMPEQDGFEVCRELRKTSNIPILFLSSRDEEIDKILGLELGADDYLTKPFSPRELVARVKAILKRTTHTSNSEKETQDASYKHGQIMIEPDKYLASWNGHSLDLTATEFAILKAMVQSPEIVFDRDRLMDHAYGGNIHVNDRTIDSHIRNIRQKFTSVGCSESIKTIRGIGYKLA